MVKKVVVVGNGMVGHKFVESLMGTGQPFDITVVNEEKHLAYDRVHLSSYLDFDNENAALEHLKLASSADYAAWGVSVIPESALELDLAGKVVKTSSHTVPYDILVLATGSYPFVPPIKGKDLEGVYVYRTLEDLDKIRARAKHSKSGVVVGGGLLGLEGAGALQKLGLETHVVEFAPRLMPVQLDEAGGKLLKRKIEATGVSVHLGKNTECLLERGGVVCGLKFVDGTTLETDMVVFSAGIRPRDELARQSGLTVGERGGIVIDEAMQTSDPSVYAIGECALYQNRIYGLVAPGYTMARGLADLLSGGDSSFSGADMSTQLKLLGVDVCSFGDAQGQTPGAEELSFTDPLSGVYKKVVLSSDGKTLLGGILVGDASEYRTLLMQYQTGIELTSSGMDLILPARGGVSLPKLEMPSAATVCSCENVSKGSICSAVRAGAHDLAGIKGATRAATGCGGCAALVGDLLKSELEAMGIAVSNAICEHFDYSRQELYHLIRVREYQSFETLLEGHGHGAGCEICKPAVASILASLYDAYILGDGLETLQDTNDRFLANMQRNGTYSVVPRVPGGEITPDGLITIGSVAKKYELYSKITGGQRIDLFGARLEQLPSIWEELIGAGFESGHAYGKSLRTVKSCVGETWCRYGVQDSVTLAIELEERYRGLRGPHKFKSAVSGCTRECAEAQSKDFGIIATEKGWNLYVCGNGGMKPRHADLLAADLDKGTLIAYIDRFLMFYIRTADRLQRTSTWLEKMDGGLEYLKKVVIEDSLGLAAELEADMKRHIHNYRCEWKETLGNPDKLAQFTHFINSSEPDSGVVFVPERGQIRPAFESEKLELLPMV